MQTDWKQDWNSFVDFLAESVAAGKSGSDLADKFGGEVVFWKGKLESKLRLDDDAPLVSISLPQRTIQFPDGIEVVIDGFGLPVASDSLTFWREIVEGSNLTFSASFLGEGAFPPVEITELPSGRRLLMLRLWNGKPVPEVNSAG